MTRRAAATCRAGAVGSRLARRIFLPLCCLLLSTPADAQNILLLIVDDVGVDRVAAYGAHPDPGSTPNIDALATDGLVFLNAWAHPTCSPSRAAALTGLPLHETGIGSPVNSLVPERRIGLDPSVLTIPKVLSPLGYESWAIGKWHLGGGETPDLDHARAAGFDYYAGSYANLVHISPEESYYDWTKIINGVANANHTVYATSDTVDEVLDRIDQATAPWFAWVAFNAAHAPFEEPPPAMHSIDWSTAGIPEKVKGMIEAVDTEIGRLLSEMHPMVLAQTTIILVGDNGTLGLATTDPFPANHAKFTVYEGGVRVPLIIAGVGLPPSNRGEVCEALVHVQDIFATVVEMGGGSSTVPSSVSMLPYLADPSASSIRTHLYSEYYLPNGIGAIRTNWTGGVRESRYKLLRADILGTDEFYDLDLDPYEGTNLLSGTLSGPEQTAYDSLKVILDAERWESVPEPGGRGSALVLALSLLVLSRSRRAR